MDDTDKARIDLAWKFFELHANQRTTMFRFFSAMVPLVIAGYFYLANFQPGFSFPYTLAALAVIGFVLSIGFLMIDQRNVQLVNLSREHLRTLETRCLYPSGGYPGVFNSAEKSDAPCCGLARFRFVMPGMYLFAAVVFLFLAIFPPAAKASPTTTPPAQATQSR
jgi:hypothetical protein